MVHGTKATRSFNNSLGNVCQFRLLRLTTEDAVVVATLVGELLREIMAAVNDKVFTLGHDDTMQCLVPVRG